jgi:hypothetical protein
MAVSLLITGYYRHPKMMAANRASGGELAEVLWCRGLDYVNEHETDGFIPSGVPHMLCPTKTAARIKALVAAGLWRDAEDGWQVHDYDEWNLRASERAARKKDASEAKSRAGKKGAAVRWGSKVHRPDDGTCHSSDMADPVADDWQTDGPGPGPGPGPWGSSSREDLEVELPDDEPTSPEDVAAIRRTLRAVVSGEWGMDVPEELQEPA